MCSRLVVKPAPAVSVIICTRNRAQSLSGTLHSLTKLESSHAWEALVVDNASVDDTRQVIDGADDCGGRLRRLQVDQVGLGAARDAAWRQARGSIVSFTDDDCYLKPDYVDAIVNVFGAHPKVGCVGGRIMLFDPLDARVTIDERDVPHQIEPFQFINAGEIHGANLSFRRDVLNRIGGFDPQLGAGTRFPCEDIDAVAAAIWAGTLVRFDPGPMVYHRRRSRDDEKLWAAYDHGRGAYYAKYILRSDTRSDYMRGWWRLAIKDCYWSSLVRLSRELTAAIAYLVHRKCYGFLLMAAPVGLSAYCIIGVLVVLRFTNSRISSYIARPVARLWPFVQRNGLR